MRVVTNAGPLIHLSGIDRLGLLHALYDEVLVPYAVYDEVLPARPDIPGIEEILAAFSGGWLSIRPHFHHQAHFPSGKCAW